MIKPIVGKRGTTYSVRWRVEGRQLAVNVKTKRLAERAEAYTVLHPGATQLEVKSHLFGAVAAEPAAPARARGVLLTELFATWTLTRRHISDARRTADRHLWESQCQEFHSRRVDAVTASEVEIWLADLIEQGYASKTISDAFAVLRSVFALAERERLVTYNPVRFVKVPRITRETRITDSDVFTPAQVLAVLDAASDEYRALFALLITTGARLSEALGLQAGDLDLGAEPPTVTYRRRAQEVDGTITIVDGFKTGTADPRWETPLPLPELAARELAAHLARRNSQPGDYLFTSLPGPRTKGGSLPSRSSLRQRYWVPTLERAGVHYVSMRNLRHTAITHALAAGISLAGVQARVGHASGSRITLERYARVLPAQLVTDHARLDDLYRNAKPTPAPTPELDADLTAGPGDDTPQ